MRYTRKTETLEKLKEIYGIVETEFCPVNDTDNTISEVYFDYTFPFPECVCVRDKNGFIHIFDGWLFNLIKVNDFSNLGLEEYQIHNLLKKEINLLIIEAKDTTKKEADVVFKMFFDNPNVYQNFIKYWNEN